MFSNSIPQFKLPKLPTLFYIAGIEMIFILYLYNTSKSMKLEMISILYSYKTSKSIKINEAETHENQ